MGPHKYTGTKYTHFVEGIFFLIIIGLQIPVPYKCNSQFVERAVKTTSKIVANYPGHDEQDGAILNTESSRAKMPTSSKKPKLSQLVN